jgi:hypothetical protein
VSGAAPKAPAEKPPDTEAFMGSAAARLAANVLLARYVRRTAVELQKYEKGFTTGTAPPPSLAAGDGEAAAARRMSKRTRMAQAWCSGREDTLGGCG